MESKEQEGSWISRNGVCFTREQLKEKLCESMGGNEDIDRCLYGYISLIRKQLKEKEALESEIERLERIKEELRDMESMEGNVDTEEYLAEFLEGYISLIRKQLKEKEARESERLERIKEKLRESMGGNVDIEEYLAEFLKGYISDSNMERNIDDYYNNDSHHR